MIVDDSVTASDDARKTDLIEIQALTPFSQKELKGKKFTSGNMLGAAMPLQQAKQNAADQK